jgi:flagellar basal-body rod protein FlgC
MDINKSVAVSAAGLKAQSMRMRVIAENIANQDSVATSPGADPYRRRVPTFKAVVDRELGATSVVVDKIRGDKSDFRREYSPGHPAADAQGYIRTPNVNGLVEQADMQNAQRSYEANLNAIEAARSMTARTIDLLR